MNKNIPFLRGFVFITVGLLLGTIMLLIIDKNQVPAKAQAQELFELYLEMDNARQESAQIFAELMLVVRNPERAGSVDDIGAKPSLSPKEELVVRLQENRVLVEQTLNTINADKFTDPEVELRYDAVLAFYTNLFKFEDMVLAELAIAENNSEHFARMATTLFEGSDWPALLAEDAQLREMLASLAILHGLEFAPLSYEDIVRARMIELDTTIVSDEVSTIIHPFTVDETAVIKVVISIEFDIQLSDKIQVSLEDPRGRIISSDQLVEYYPSSEADRVSNITREGSVIVIVLFPDDPLVNPILGDWKLYVTAPIGSNMFIGMIQL